MSFYVFNIKFKINAVRPNKMYKMGMRIKDFNYSLH